MSMSKLDMLIIRACKSKDPHKRLRSVYIRFYIFGQNDRQDLDMYILHMLFNVLDKYFPTLPSQAIMFTHEGDYFKHLTWAQRGVVAVIHRIRYEQIDKICPEEMIWPVCYRRVA